LSTLHAPTAIALAVLSSASAPGTRQLDDIWDAAHAQTLGESLGQSSLLITTRVASLFPGIHDVPCGVLTVDTALQLLLRCGGVAMPQGSAVPQAALDVVELCGCLPLALELAGALMQEYADVWETELVPFLRSADKLMLRRGDGDDNSGGECCAEDRVIFSSLTLLQSKGHHAAVTLFYMCAAFAEDAVVPTAVFDVLEAIFHHQVRASGHERGAGSPAGGGNPKKLPRPRRCLTVLLKFSLLQGSIRDGIMIHDLAHACACARMPSRALLQHDILHALCGALKQPAPAAGIITYAEAYLQHHVRAALGTLRDAPSTPPLAWNNRVLELAIDHPLGWVQTAIALGVGSESICATARMASSEEQWLRAGQLWALASCADQDEGQCRMEAWQALRRVEPIDDASVGLEAIVLRGLILKKGGLQINSREYVEANERLETLVATEPGQRSAALAEVHKVTKSAYYFAQLHAASAVHRREGFLEVYTKLLPVSTTGHTPTRTCPTVKPLMRVPSADSWLASSSRPESWARPMTLLVRSQPSIRSH
jgi:hypothetical protein